MMIAITPSLNASIRPLFNPTSDPHCWSPLFELAVVLARLKELLEVPNLEYIFDCGSLVRCMAVIGLAYLISDVISQVGRPVLGFVALVQPVAPVFAVHLLFELEPELALS